MDKIYQLNVKFVPNIKESDIVLTEKKIVDAIEEVKKESYPFILKSEVLNREYNFYMPKEEYVLEFFTEFYERCPVHTECVCGRWEDDEFKITYISDIFGYTIFDEGATVEKVYEKNFKVDKVYKTKRVIGTVNGDEISLLRTVKVVGKPIEKDNNLQPDTKASA